MASVNLGADLDISGFFVNNLKPEQVASLPPAAASNDGRVVFLTSDGHFYMGSGSTWHPLGIDVGTLEGVTAAQLRDRSTHSGVQPASTISDLKSAVTAYPISDFASATGDIDAGSNKIINLSNGTSSTDAVNKGQLDAVSAVANAAASGFALKDPARAVSTTNITLSGVQTVDGVSLGAGDRVLVAGQTNKVDNGIYTVAAGSWAYAADADETGELAPGTLIGIAEGTVNHDSLWGLTVDSSITPGTSQQEWSVLISATTGVQAGDGIDKTGNVISINLDGASSGLALSGSGLSVDESTVSIKYVGAVPAGTSPITVTHNLGTEDVAVTVRDASTGQQVLVPWNSNGTPNSVQLEFGVGSISSGDYRVRIDG